MNVKANEQTLRAIAGFKESLRAAVKHVEQLEGERGNYFELKNRRAHVSEIRRQLRLISQHLETENREADRFISTTERGVGRLRMPVTRSGISNHAISLGRRDDR